MHILLTDVLTCPNCGPQYGLILLADVVRERRVYEGVLGCPNCREQYPVRQGGAALGAAAHISVSPDPVRAERFAALMGATQGMVLLIGPASADAAAMAELLPDVEVITSAWGVTDVVAPEEMPGVSRLGFGGATLPLANGKMHAVTLSGTAADVLLEEGVRVVSAVGRLVLEPPPADAAERLRKAGFRVLARDAERLVATRSL
jgi:uncharacterized protein YbaR (Trm112 family)